MNTLCNIPEGCLSIKHRQQQDKDFKKNCRKINNTAGKTSKSTACLFQLWLNLFSWFISKSGNMCRIMGQNESTGVGRGSHFFHGKELRATGEPPGLYQRLISAEQARRRYQDPAKPCLLGQSHFTRLG